MGIEFFRTTAAGLVEEVAAEEGAAGVVAPPMCTVGECGRCEEGGVDWVVGGGVQSRRGKRKCVPNLGMVSGECTVFSITHSVLLQMRTA